MGNSSKQYFTSMLIVVLTLAFSLATPLRAEATTRNKIQLTSKKSNVADVELEIQIHKSAEEMNEQLKAAAHSDKKGEIYIDPKVTKKLGPIKEGLNLVSQRFKTTLVHREHLQQSAMAIGQSIVTTSKAIGTSAKERLTQWVTVSIISGTAFVSWYFVGHAELTTASLLTAWTVVNAIYFNVMIDTYHKTIDSSVRLMQRIAKKTSHKWDHRYRHLTLWLMSVGINFGTLALINWNSLPAILQTSPFYLYALKNATLGYLASDLWTAVFNRWKTNERFSWKTLRYMSYVKNIGLTFTLPLMMLEHFSGYVGTGVFILSGAIFNTKYGERLININYSEFFKTVYEKAKTQLQKRSSLAPVRCEAAINARF